MEWRKSSASGPEGGNCVEVAMAGCVLVRNSRFPERETISFSPASWNAFLGLVRMQGPADRG
ncbi:DUF397 domain-containing protein [Streptomyces sp. NPDC090306]|uniref:DUF397 domain-containing protein n=1 Tax=Streptomyces sp. NPDC090306 TaxID=3365961 RepID=UPI00381F2617